MSSENTFELRLAEDWIPDTPEIDPTWPVPVKLGVYFGFLIPGHTLEDYLLDGADPVNQGYETVLIWGVQGSGKSCRMLQMGFWVLGDWELVLKCLVFRPRDVVDRLEAVPDDQRLAMLLWDDIGVHYPSSTFKTDIASYEAIDSTWASIRTKVGIVITTIPLSDRLAKNIKDNVTMEVFLGKNQMELVYRIFRLPGFRSLQANFFKAMVEEPERFNLYDVPAWVWNRYWVMRLKLAREALETLKGVVEVDGSNYISCLDAGGILKISPNTVQQMISRGTVRGRKIKGVMSILDEDMERLIPLYKEIKGRTHRRPRVSKKKVPVKRMDLKPESSDP